MDLTPYHRMGDRWTAPLILDSSISARSIEPRLTDSRGRECHMACPARELPDKGIESAKTSRALEEFFRRERQSREDRVSIWWVSVGMVMAFLLLVSLLIQVSFSGPKNRNPTESAWYHHALPPFKILSRARLGSVLPPICHTALSFLPFTKP